jgi:putative membrane protein insertion efficiency factor
MAKVISHFLILVIRIYQITVSPLLGQRCRFHPSCSQYMIDALAAKGVVRGIAMGIVRICKCHPFHPGGYDPVK